MKVPGLRSSYEKVGGIVYFGRMLDKIRLHAAGRLPDGYNLGTKVWTWFDARCTRFLAVNYEAVVERVLAGGTDDEILAWCFEHGRRPSEEEIEIWNEFMLKRGWHDSSSSRLAEAKRSRGFADRDDIQTAFEFHLADESSDETPAAKPSIQHGAIKIPGLRHSAEQVCGLVFFGRMLDKIRLHARGKLPPDYKHGAGTDLRVCRFLRVEYPEVVAQVLAGRRDEEVLEWCFEHGRRPDEEEILVFNAFLTKRGWRDNQSAELEQMKRERGFADRTDIQTFFDFHKADEAED